MNPRKLLLPILALGISATAFSQIPSAAVWPLPTVPASTNPETIPTPRDEWVARVQGFLDHNKGQHYDLIFDGDSITDFWQRVGKPVWMDRYGALNAVDYGIAADKVENLLWRLQEGQVNGMDPKLVVLMIGTNNTARDSIDQIAEGVTQVVSEYEKRCPHAHILLLAIFPRSALASDPVRGKITAINLKLATLASDRVTYLDIGAKFLQPDGTLTKEIMPDFLHPSARGYQIWADAIQPVVDKYFPPAEAQSPVPVAESPIPIAQSPTPMEQSPTPGAPAVSGTGAGDSAMSSPSAAPEAKSSATPEAMSSATPEAKSSATP